MQDALDVLKAKLRKDGAWLLEAKHPGQAHFDMETPGQPAVGTPCAHCGC